MKITAVLLLLFCLQVGARGLSQTVSLSVRNASLQQVFHEIKKQTNLSFIWDEQSIDLSAKISIHVKNREVREVLAECLKNQPFTYQLLEKIVVISRKPPSNVSRGGAYSAPPIRGRIISEKGEGLPGATVVLKGSSISTYTDSEGNFQLVIPENFARPVIVISSQGYKEKEIVIGEKTTLNVALEVDVKSLNEVYVVGYGTQRKSDLTGSVARVKSEQLQERPALNLEQGLAGRVSGVNVSTNSGRPGGRTQVRIRGFNSIQASNDPLYVVDGIIFTADVNTLNPNDIETIDVLKDASATSIYGTRGSNGVIIITTKKGRKGGQVNYSNFFSLNTLPRKIEVLNSKEFMWVEETAYKNAPKYDSAGFVNGLYEDPIEKRKRFIEGNAFGNRTLFELDGNGVPQPLYDVDWQKETTRSSVSQGHNISFTGGDEKSNYGFYLGYNDEQGIVRGSYSKRYTVRGTLERQMNKWLKMGGNIGYSRNNERRIDTRTGYNDVLRQMIEMVSFIPYKYPDGTYGTRTDYGDLEEGDNPLMQTHEDHNLFNTNTFTGNSFATINLFKGLDFTSTIGANITNGIDPYYNSEQSLIVAGNRASVSSRETRFLQFSNRLNYTKQFNSNTSLNVLLGTEFQKYSFYDFNVTSDRFSEDYYMWYNLGAGATPQAPGSSYNAYQMASYFARANFKLKEQYLFTVTSRYDGSSRFGENNKYALFPSAAFAWKVNEEGFMQDVSSVSNLKLRLSYGITGNSEIGSYLSQANLRSTAYPFGGFRASGTVIQTLPNPLLKWEKTAQYNAGFDIGLLNNRFTIEADFYLKKTKDLLLAAPVPTTSGYSSLTKNIGSMENKGIDLSITSVNIQRQQFSWTTNFIFSTFKNRITALGDKNEDIIMDPWQGLILKVGHPVNSFYGYIREGVWGTNEKDKAQAYGLRPGDLKWADLNNDGVVNTDDRTIMGSGLPRFYGTLSNSFTYSNFDLVFELQFSKGNQIFNMMSETGEGRQGLANSFKTVLNAWTPENQNSFIAELRPPSAGYISDNDSYLIEDASFIRCKNLAIGYNFPKAAYSKLGLLNLRLFVSGQNLFLLTKYKGYDPEVTTWDDPFAQGMTFYDYPKARTIMFGLTTSL